MKRRGVEFWKEAVGKMKGSENVVELAGELKVDKRQLYYWRSRLDPVEEPSQNQQEARLSREVERLKRVLADAAAPMV